MKTQCPYCGYIYKNLTKDAKGTAAECFFCGNTFEIKPLVNSYSVVWRCTILLALLLLVFFLVSLFFSNPGVFEYWSLYFWLLVISLINQVLQSNHIRQNNLEVERRYSK